MAAGELLTLVWLWGSALPPVAHAQGTVRYVAPGGNCGGASPCYSTPQSAVDAAQSGDEIRVAAGTYAGVQTPASAIRIVDKSLTLRGGYTTTNWNTPAPSANLTIVDAQRQGAVMTIAGVINVTVEGLRLTGGSSDYIGVVVTDATVNMRNCTVYDNHRSGLYFQDSTATLSHNTIISNTASSSYSVFDGGGASFWSSTVTLDGNLVQGNVANTSYVGQGGGISLKYSNATLTNNTIVSNTASTVIGYGGGLSLEGSAAALTGNTIRGNQAGDLSGNGGGVYLLLSDNTTLNGNIIQDNVASTKGDGHGGGLVIDSTAATLTNNTIVSNTATTANGTFGYGGGVRMKKTTTQIRIATLIGNTVQGNLASVNGPGEGGGLYVSTMQEDVLMGNTIVGNIASTSAGGLAGPGKGGGLYLYSATVLSANTIKNNRAGTAGDGYGGGVYIDSGRPTVSANTIVSNTATANAGAIGEGGGVYVYASYSFTMTNNVVADNHANTLGGGLLLSGTYSPRTIALLHNTIVNNRGIGQGVYGNHNITLAFTNTIISGHNVGVSVEAGSTAALQGTLWHGNTANWGGAGTILTGTVNVYGDPAFVNPAAGDYHIAENSAARDAGVHAGVHTDINGEPRPYQFPDLGADEYWPPGALKRLYLPLVLRGS